MPMSTRSQLVLINLVTNAWEAAVKNKGTIHLTFVLWLSRCLGSSGHLPLTPAMRSGGLVFASLALGTYGTWQSMRVPGVRTVEIPLAKLPVSLDGFSIVQLTDLHIGSLVNGDWLKSVVEKTNNLAPDLVAVTSDMVDDFADALAKDVPRLVISGPDMAYTA